MNGAPPTIGESHKKKIGKTRLRFLQIHGLLLVTVLFLVLESLITSQYHINKYSGRDQDNIIAIVTPEKIKCPGELTNRKQAGLSLVDMTEKIKIMGTPKGGATLATQLMFRKLDLMDEALSYDAWIHKYRLEVFGKSPAHRRTDSSKVCSRTGWVCIKLVRSVLDRIVSSYIHTMTYANLRESFTELSLTMKDKKPASQASFADFVTALLSRRRSKLTTKGENHFMPQSDEENDHRDDIYFIPVETVEEALDALKLKTGVFLNATGLSSSHYVDKIVSSNKNISDVSRTNWPTIKIDDATGEKYAPPYDAYLLNPLVNKRLCKLLCSDFALYARTCQSSWLRKCPKTQKVCDMERERIVTVCGNGYDFFA